MWMGIRTETWVRTHMCLCVVARIRRADLACGHAENEVYGHMWQAIEASGRAMVLVVEGVPTDAVITNGVRPPPPPPPAKRSSVSRCPGPICTPHMGDSWQLYVLRALCVCVVRVLGCAGLRQREARWARHGP